MRFRKWPPASVRIWGVRIVRTSFTIKMKTLITSLFIATLTITAFAEDKSALGLAERRALSDYQEKVYPELLKEVHAAAGFEVPLDVKWEAIARVGEADKYMDEGYWTKIFFKPLAGALSGISQDDMGKEALKAKLKQIVITFDEATAPASNYPNGVTFDGGILTINFTPYSNVDDVQPRIEAIRSVMEPKL